jgi:NAD(P)H dehydrogenase (quinone)
MFAISAATGEFGRLVVDHLLRQVPAAEVAVVVRSPSRADDLAARGVEVRYGDYDDPASLHSAFAGIDRLLFISSPDIGTGKRVSQHRDIIGAARHAGVSTIVYTSGLGADLIDEGVLGEHHATERALLDSGVPHTVLRHPIYSDFFLNPQLRAAIEAGELTSSTGGRGMNTASRADLAEAAAAVLANAGHVGRAYNFTGRLWTYPQLAAALSSLSGRTVVYRELDRDEGIVAMLGLGPVIRSGAFELQTGDLEQVLGHPPTSLEAAVAAAIDAPSVR